jgi:acyl carrier protein
VHGHRENCSLIEPSAHPFRNGFGAVAGLLGEQFSNRHAKFAANILAVSPFAGPELPSINHALKRIGARRLHWRRSSRVTMQWHAPCDPPEDCRRLCLRGAASSESGMADGTGISTQEQITAIVEGLLAKRTGPQRVQADQNLTEAGLTSLDMVNLMLAIEAEFYIEIPQSAMTPDNFDTVRAIQALVSVTARAA